MEGGRRSRRLCLKRRGLVGGRRRPLTGEARRTTDGTEGMARQALFFAPGPLVVVSHSLLGAGVRFEAQGALSCAGVQGGHGSRTQRGRLTSKAPPTRSDNVEVRTASDGTEPLPLRAGRWLSL